jgi:hypothetical protein
MARRLTNLLLTVLLVGLVATGFVGWIWPVDAVWPTYSLHRALGVALVLASGWKYGIARASLARRVPRADCSILPGGLLALATLATALLGLGWTLGLLSFDAFWGYSPLNVHVFVGVGLLVPLLAHAALRWERGPPTSRLVGRRSVLRLGGIGAAALAAAWLVGPSGARRFTGSKHAGSFSGNAYPSTIWFLDAVPRLDPATWLMTVGGAEVTYQQLTTAFPLRELTAVLDCTGGWWSEQRWQGVSLGDLLDAAGVGAGSHATVVSVTGHAWRFPLDELRGAIVATHVGGEVLTPEHGFPARLAIPGRRGFQWVKWVDRIDIA